MSLTQRDDHAYRHDARSPQPAAMSRIERGPVELLLRRLERSSPLDEGDRALVRDLVGTPVQHKVGADLGDDGEMNCRLLVSGWACRASETPWGDRQILDFLTPGDAIGLSMRPRMNGLYRVVVLSRSVTVDASALRERLRDEPERYPKLRRACLDDERFNALRMVEHTNRLGASTAAQAMAHLLLDLRGRMDQIGQLDGERFPMPLSQETLHEALGITVTQVYRVLTQMRRDGLIRLGPGWAEIPSPAALAAAAGLGPWRR